MLPPEGVNLKALDMMFRITILSFSLSAHIIIAASGNWKVKLTSFSSERTRNSFWKETTNSLKSINDTCKRIFPFCIFRKSSIWLTSCNIWLVFFSISSTYCTPFGESVSCSLNSCIGPFIKVRGVRSSWEIFVKNLIFISETFCSM